MTSTAQDLVDKIEALQRPTWQMQQRAPRLVRLHPRDFALIEGHCTGSPPMLNGSEVQAADDVGEGAPEIVE